DDLGLRGEGQLRAGLVHGGGDLHGGAVGGLLRGQRDAGDLLARRVGQGDRLAVRVEAPGATGDGGDDGAARVGDDRRVVDALLGAVRRQGRLLGGGGRDGRIGVAGAGGDAHGGDRHQRGGGGLLVIHTNSPMRLIEYAHPITIGSRA